MQLDLDKRYFGEYIPPERCECDCSDWGGLAITRHRYNCATVTGKYWANANTTWDAPTAGVPNLLADVFNTALSKHPMFVFLQNHRLSHCLALPFFSGRLPPILRCSSSESKYFCIWVAPYLDQSLADALFINEIQRMDILDINLYLLRDKKTGRVYLKVAKHAIYSSYTTYTYTNCSLKSKSLEKLANPNYRIKCYDIKPTGSKQAWLDTMKTFSLYTTASKVIVSDVVNEIAPQFFKEQA